MLLLRLSLALIPLALLGPVVAHGDDGLGRFGSLFSPGNSAGLSLAVEPGGDDRPDIHSQGLRGSAIVSKSGADVWSATGRLDRLALSRSPVIPRTSAPFPDTLWQVEGGGAFTRKQGDRRQWGANVSLGSASDQPFHSLRETEIQATATRIVPSGPRNSWIFFLSYSNNRTFANGVPLPGLAYVVRVPARNLLVVAGFPFFMGQISPTPDWTFRATLFGTTNQSLDVSRRINGRFRGFGALTHGARTWFRAGRTTRSDRLIYEQTRAVLGLRASAAGGMDIELSGGRVFGRRLSEAKNVRSRNVSRIHLDDGWVLTAELVGRWGGRPSG